MNTDAITYKKNFNQECGEYELPMHNKAAFLFTLTAKCKKNPSDECLRRLLMAAVCDCDLLFDHFYPEKSHYELESEYASLCRNLRLLETALKYEKQLETAWQEILNRKTIPNKFASTASEHAIDVETTFLVNLFRDIFCISETNSRCLYDNINALVRMTKGYPLLRKAAPLFFFQTMVRHTSRLATNESFASFSLSSLWSYKEYVIKTNNGKNFDTYKSLSRLFRKLLKFYKEDTEIDRDLCRYGFHACSNLPEWIAFMQEKKYKKLITPLKRFHLENPQTYCEAYEQFSGFDTISLYRTTSKKEDKYFLELVDSSLFDDIENKARHYLDVHMDLLINCMNNIHLDTNTVKDCMLTVYNQSGVERLFPEHIPLPYRLSTIHYMVTNYIDDIVNTRVREIL